MNQACSGFESESPAFSGLEPERPVTIPYRCTVQNNSLRL